VDTVPNTIPLFPDYIVDPGLETDLVFPTKMRSSFGLVAVLDPILNLIKSFSVLNRERKKTFFSRKFFFPSSFDPNKRFRKKKFDPI
jgi:hypothetical protein